MKWLWFALLIEAIELAGLASPEESINYDKYKVLRVIPETRKQLAYLIRKENSGIDFWKGPSYLKAPVDILLSPDDVSFSRKIKRSKMKIREIVRDVGREIRNQSVCVGASTGNLTWEEYPRLDDINLFLEEMNRLNPEITTIFSIGKSIEGRDLNVMKVFKPGGPAEKPAIFINANTQAREWITSAVASYVIYDLINNEYGEIQLWTEEFDWYILPVSNPDGFVYSHTTDRLWSKNLRELSDCYGVNLNRNYDYKWQEGTTECTASYAGETPFSEPESQSVADFISSLGSRLKLYLDLQNYGQLVLFPYGDTADNFLYDLQMGVGKEIIKAAHERYNTTYITGNWFQQLYRSTGSSVDWVFKTTGVNLAYSYFLRDTGNYGFLLPAEQIEPTALEFIDSLFPIINRLRKWHH